MADLRKSFCRNCGAQCGVELEIVGDRITQLRGDRENPISKGYFCIKGEASKKRQNGAKRLLASQKKTRSGHVAIPTGTALDEVAQHLKALVSRYGPRSVGLYYGTGAYSSSLAISFAKSWMDCLGSPHIYSSQTIDQSPKTIAALRMGAFKSGRQPFSTADVWLISGSNPLVSHFGGWGGPTMYAPAADIRAARKRGLKLIVIDPRRTETARLADIYLQPRPGQDVAIYAAMLNVILNEGLYDHAFCGRYVVNLDTLRGQVAGYTTEMAAEAAGVPAADIAAAAVMFARGPTGCATSGTGPNMAPHANLAEHLLECLNIVCGRYRREGDAVLNPSLLSAAPVREGVYPAFPIWDHSPKMASHPNVGWAIPNEYPSNLLADEIVWPGEDRLRALIVVGGNPLTAIPDHAAITTAFARLELLVSLDTQMSETAMQSHYVIGCKTPYERADLALMTDGNSPAPVVQYTEPIMPAPPEAIEEWQFFYELGRHLGIQMEWTFSLYGMPPTAAALKLDMTHRPAVELFFDHMCRHPEAGFDLIKKGAVGKILQLSQQVVLAAEPDDNARLDVMPAAVVEEFSTCRQSRQQQSLAADELLLHSRRLLEAMNSNYIDSDITRGRYPANPFYMNPADMVARDLSSGDDIEVWTAHGRLHAVVKADPSERQGAASMHHCWARRFSNDGVESVTEPISVLIDRNSLCESHNFVPRMSAIPVRVRSVTRA